MNSNQSPAIGPPANAPVALSESARMAGSPAIVDFRLDNGLSVVVIPDHRAPVVTHMVWYRNGSADDPPGKSGIAHFLEHLMFKGTKAHRQGQFSDVVAELGGQENAFTGNDYTAYFQRVAKEHLGVMMEFEADRMTGLVLTDEIVAPERDVVMEERRMHCDADPGAQLNEAVQAALFTHHPYGVPIIGWSHEIEGLNRADALAYYHRFYTPENAILVVAGDVETEEVRALAEAHYGKIKPRGEPPQRDRPQEPAPVARRLVTLNDEKVEQPSWQRCYIAPSSRTAEPGEAEALEVLAHLLGGGQTSLLYRSLVLDQRIAVVAGAHYMGTALDETRFFLYAMPNPGVTMETLDAAIDRILAKFIADGVDPAALERAKTRLVADAIYAQDSQAMLARWYGSSLATGLSMEDIRQWPTRIEAVEPAAILAAAKKHLDRRKSVTGHLLPLEEPLVA
jgi:zinc protease